MTSQDDAEQREKLTDEQRVAAARQAIVSHLERALRTIAERRAPAPRIDTLRNQLAGSAGLLQKVAEECEDLHALAYDRQRAAAQRERVHGGAVDYALDTHGDPRARNAYRLLAVVAVATAELLAHTTHDATRLLADSRRGGRTRRSIDGLELANAIRNQAKRVQRGEYTPVRRYPQPGTHDAINAVRREFRQQIADLTADREALRVERDALIKRVKKLEKAG